MLPGGAGQQVLNTQHQGVPAGPTGVCGTLSPSTLPLESSRLFLSCPLLAGAGSICGKAGQRGVNSKPNLREREKKTHRDQWISS